MPGNMIYRREFIGEALGAFVLVLFGCGSIAVAVLFGAHQGLMPLALAWGIGVTLAIYLTRHLSCAHLNPAVSLAMVVSRRMSARRMPVFIGLTVTSIICLIAPLTQAGLNPARDLAPRLVAWLMGWGNAALPDRVGGFFHVYVLAPMLGGVVAALSFVRVLEPTMKAPFDRCGCATDKSGLKREPQ